MARRFRSLAWMLCLLVGSTAGCSLVRRVGNHKPMLRQVDPAVAFEMLRDSPALFILDLRSAAEFHGPKGHLHGATNIPLRQLSQRLSELIGYREHTFLVYCDGTDCGQKGMHILLAGGFDSAILIVGGIDGWIADGYGTVGRAPAAHPTTGAPKASSAYFNFKQVPISK